MSTYLQLSLTDYEDETRWRWLLSDASGNFLADHEVELDSKEPLYQGFVDLRRYVKRYTLPSYPMEQVLNDVGEWMGEQVFGGLLDVLRDEMTYPTTVVEVGLPTEAQALLFRPFELAYLDGEPFAECGIRFIYQLAGEKRRGKRGKQGEQGEALRVLAVYSLPVRVSPLNLRRERYQMKCLVDQLRQTEEAAVELRVIQYGATRQTLKEALREGAGWDVIHLSGHGLEGKLALEDEQGKLDIIETDELAKLLRPTGSRLKLLVLSACLSGAGSLQHARAMLGLESESSRERGAAAQTVQQTRLPSLAQQLSQKLRCAALAMRYPVGDSFAIVLALGLYKSLFERAQSLPNALQLALDDAMDAKYASSLSPLSRVTPILFGAQASDLLLTPPPAQGQYKVPTTGLLKFPHEPKRFVGRILPMLNASQALAPKSPHQGVLFYGMAGAGKTSCALELAYRHETGRFQGYVWFKAPDEGQDIRLTLANFLQDIESQLDMKNRGILLAHADDPVRFVEESLPRLQGMLRERATLIVIDNIESLLTKSGDWRGAKWEALMSALLTRTGASRLVLTSRRQPISLIQQPQLLHLPIHALSLPESTLLARELSQLRPLFADETGRALLRRTLKMAQGHPKLLELADSMAADGRLRALNPSNSGGQERLDAFFRTGESQQSAEDFIATLRDWTSTLTATLSPTTRLLFHFLCRLEEEDRESDIIQNNWGDFLNRLKETTLTAASALKQPNFALDTFLAALVNTGLIESRLIEPNTAQSPVTLYRIHPAIAETGRDEAEAVVLKVTDIQLGNFWGSVVVHGVQNEMQGGTSLVVTGARRAVPYLLRGERWEEVGTLLEGLIQRDQTPTTFGFGLPFLRQITDVTQGTDLGLQVGGILAMALLFAGRDAEAEQLQRDTIAQCVAQRDYRSASALTGQLLNLLIMTCRYDDGLKMVEEKGTYTRRAGLGRWSQLSDEIQRLQILNALGRYDEVLKRVNALRPELTTLPDKSTADESAMPWNVREIMLDTGHTAALGLEEWKNALYINEEIIVSKKIRRASYIEVASARFNDYAPLLRLRRYAEARALLMHCRAVAERANQIAQLGRTLSALADLEDKVSNRAAAVQFSQSGLRYHYQAGEPEDCARSHNNLANYLEAAGAAANLILAHRLAACIIGLQTQSGALSGRINRLANSPIPALTFDEVVATVEQIEGVRFRELFARLSASAPNGDAAIAAVWEMAMERRGEA